MEQDAPVLLIDSSSIAYQAQYSFKDLSHEDMATGVLFGFLSRILFLGIFFKTNRIVFCWDSKYSLRKKAYSGYKKKRVAITEEDIALREIMFRQIFLLRRKILPKIGFNNHLRQKGHEADDMMAKYCHQSLEDVIIITTDEDLFQCISSTVRTYSQTKRKMMTKKKFTSEYGIKPYDWRMVKAIAGCRSDEVPGVKGVGAKTAIKYMRKELPDGVKKRSIDEAIESGYIEEMLYLVALPLPTTKDIKLKDDSFSVKNLIKISSKYNMASFKRADKKMEWKNLFKGEF